MATRQRRSKRASNPNRLVLLSLVHARILFLRNHAQQKERQMSKASGNATRWFVNVFRAADKLGVETIEDHEYAKLNKLRSAGRTATHAALIMWGDPDKKRDADQPALI